MPRWACQATTVPVAVIDDLVIDTLALENQEISFKKGVHKGERKKARKALLGSGKLGALSPAVKFKSVMYRFSELYPDRFLSLCCQNIEPVQDRV